MAEDTANTPTIERIARVLAGRAASANADGDEASAAATVDRMWPDHLDDAISILKALREPDAAIARVGDGQLWTRMIEAALGNELPASTTLPANDEDQPPEIGSAPLIEGP
jgi:hypothetical protein